MTIRRNSTQAPVAFRRHGAFLALRVCALGLVTSLLLVPALASAQDGGGGRVAKEIFLDDEELNVEADLPSVDLVLTFKGLRYENIDPKKTFFPELFKTVESEPF